ISGLATSCPLRVRLLDQAGEILAEQHTVGGGKGAPLTLTGKGATGSFLVPYQVRGTKVRLEATELISGTSIERSFDFTEAEKAINLSAQGFAKAEKELVPPPY